MKDDLTLIAVVLDRSGSMANIAKDMEGGLDTLIKDQATQPGECRVTLAQFDDKYEVVADYVDAKTITTPFPLTPRGSTALLDAIGKTITTVGESLAKFDESERPSKVIFAIITDGMENASREWTKDKVLELVKRQTDTYGWEFSYLGANQDAIAVGASMGIHNSMDYVATAAGASNSFGAMSASVTRTRSGLSATYTEDEKNAAMGNVSNTAGTPA